VSEDHLRKVELDQRLPSCDLLLRLAKILGVSAGELLDGRGLAAHGTIDEEKPVDRREFVRKAAVGAPGLAFGAGLNYVVSVPAMRMLYPRGHG
jgi:transcriptional regulator with XRE-family HTH domain